MLEPGPLDVSRSRYHLTRENRRRIPTTSYKSMVTLQAKNRIGKLSYQPTGRRRIMFERVDAAMPGCRAPLMSSKGKRQIGPVS